MKTVIVENGDCRCPHCGEEIDVSQFGRGVERTVTREDQERQQRQDLMEDLNKAAQSRSTITLEQLKSRQR